MEAKITLEYHRQKLAKAVADAVSPDNFKAPQYLHVETTVEEKNVVTVINCDGELATFIATIDDLLSSAAIAERTLKSAGKT